MESERLDRFLIIHEIPPIFSMMDIMITCPDNSMECYKDQSCKVFISKCMVCQPLLH